MIQKLLFCLFFWQVVPLQVARCRCELISCMDQLGNFSPVEELHAFLSFSTGLPFSYSTYISISLTMLSQWDPSIRSVEDDFARSKTKSRDHLAIEKKAISRAHDSSFYMFWPHAATCTQYWCWSKPECKDYTLLPNFWAPHSSVLAHSGM